jgi:hypothetical protein
MLDMHTYNTSHSAGDPRLVFTLAIGSLCTGLAVPAAAASGVDTFKAKCACATEPTPATTLPLESNLRYRICDQRMCRS